MIRLPRSTSRLLPGTDGAYYPFWSPRAIAYFARDKLWRADLVRGAPVALCDVGSEGRGGTWGDEGVIVFASFGSGLRQISAAGGSPMPLTELDTSHGEISHYWTQSLRRTPSVRGAQKQ